MALIILQSGQQAQTFSVPQRPDVAGELEPAILTTIFPVGLTEASEVVACCLPTQRF